MIIFSNNQKEITVVIETDNLETRCFVIANGTWLSINRLKTLL